MQGSSRREYSKVQVGSFVEITIATADHSEELQQMSIRIYIIMNIYFEYDDCCE
jgi:hypothetical protein